MSTRKKWLKRLGYGLGGLVLTVVAAALILPYLFKDKIAATAKQYINESVHATVDFTDVDLSLLWTFPQFSFELSGLSVTGKDEFEGVKLMEMQRFVLRLNLWSVIMGDYTVKGIILDKPSIYVKVLNNGKANYDIAKADSTAVADTTTTTEEAAGDFKVQLSYYAINDAKIIYEDNSTNTRVAIEGLTHSGTADFTATKYDLFTKTSIEALSASYERVSYLSKKRVEADFNVMVDMDAMKFTLLDNRLKINDLELNAEGWLAMPKEDIDMDLKFSSPATSFASVLSLIPGAYIQDFASVKTGGSFSFSAFAKGIYNAQKMPAFGLDLKVADAFFQYPDLPLPVKDIAAELKVNSPGSDLDQMQINLSRFHMLLGSNPFDARFLLKTPMSDPDVDMEVKGKIDLADLSKAMPMEGVKTLNGLITANLSSKMRLSYVEKEQYERIDMLGKLQIDNMNYVAEGSPAMLIQTLQMDFSPNHVNLEDFRFKMGKSDLQAKGRLDNLLAYFSKDKTLTGNLSVNSQLLDLNEMMGSDTSSASSEPSVTDTSSAAGESEIFDRFRFAMDAKLNKIVYDVYTLEAVEAAGSFSPSTASLDNFAMRIGKSDMRASGKLQNVFDYLFGNETLRGELNLGSTYFNLNQFMSEDGAATEPEAPATPPTDPSTANTAYEPIVIPANLDLRLTCVMNKVIYDVYKLNNVQAEILVRDAKAKIVNLSCETLGGRMAFNGEYDSKVPEKPRFAFGYDLSRLDIQEVAKTVGLVQYYFPAAKGIFGRIDSRFKIDGFLDKNLYPVLDNINSEGFLITYDALVKGLKANQALAEKLKIKDLNNLVLTNTKNFFKIKNGEFELEPFNYNYKGMDMIFSGKHKLSGNGAYQSKMRIPKALIEGNTAGQAATQAADKGFGLLQQQASKAGVNLNKPEIEFYNVLVEMTGSLANPQYNIKFLSAETKAGESLGEQAGADLKAEADKLKAEAEAKAKEAEAQARAEADKLKAEADAKIKDAEAKAKAEAARLKAEAEARAKAEAQRLLNGGNSNSGSNNADSLRNGIQNAIKDKNPLQGVKNPFKKN